MARVLVIGYGNPLRGDEGIGWRVIQKLAKHALNKDCEIIACRQLTPELAEQVSKAELVIFINAEEGKSPGAIQKRAVSPHGEPPPSFSHGLEPHTLLACAQALYGFSPEGILFTVSTASFEFSETLSPEVAGAMPKLISKIKSFLDDSQQ